MTQIVEAVFDGAVLRPETALQLEPNSRVRLTVEVMPAAEAGRPDVWAAVDAIHQRLKATDRSFSDSADLLREDRDR